MNILDFPNEMQEKILSHLGIADLIAATRACPRWREIANQKLLREWCLTNIAEDILTEINQKQPNTDSLDSNVAENYWEEMCIKWASTVGAEKLPSGVELSSVNGSTDHLEAPVHPTVVATSCVCLAVSGDCVIVGDGLDHHLVWYDRFGNAVASKSNDGEPIIGIFLLDIGLDRSTSWTSVDKKYPDAPSVHPDDDALIALSSGFLTIYAMPAWHCQKLYTLREEHLAQHLSVQAKHFAHFNCLNKSLTVSRIGVTKLCNSGDVKHSGFPWSVHVDVAQTIRCSCHVQNSKLWKESVVCLLQNGTVMTSNLRNGEIHYSRAISDFLYPFESFLYRGLIFCNITTARILLNYWHVNMGQPHWLVSSDGLHFKRVKTYYPFKDEITTMCIKSTSIVVGTKCGRICFYSYKSNDALMTNMHFENPQLICKITEEAISKCDFSISGEHFIVCVETALKVVLLVTLPLIENYKNQEITPSGAFISHDA